MASALPENAVMYHMYNSEYHQSLSLLSANDVISYCYFFNVLNIFLLCFSSVGLNLSFPYVSVLGFVNKLPYSGMVIGAPVLFISIVSYIMSGLGSLDFQRLLWNASNHDIVWFVNLILNIFLLLTDI